MSPWSLLITEKLQGKLRAAACLKARCCVCAWEAKWQAQNPVWPVWHAESLWGDCSFSLGVSWAEDLYRYLPSLWLMKDAVRVDVLDCWSLQYHVQKVILWQSRACTWPLCRRVVKNLEWSFHWLLVLSPEMALFCWLLGWPGVAEMLFSFSF